MASIYIHRMLCRFWTQQCQDIFGSSINEKVLYSSINFTNANYGGLDVQVTRIIFPNGSIDPWHALGVTKDLSPDAKALFINGEYSVYPENTPAGPGSQTRVQDSRFLIIFASWVSAVTRSVEYPGQVGKDRWVFLFSLPISCNVWC